LRQHRCCRSRDQEKCAWNVPLHVPTLFVLKHSRL
jgi:hypothetical protein